MNIKEFAQRVTDEMRDKAENEESDIVTETTRYYLDCMADCGEISAPDICFFSEGRARLSAYDYNDEAESLDLFIFLHTEPATRVDSRVQTAFNGLVAFYEQCVNTKKPFRGAEREFSGEVQDAINLVRESKGKVELVRFYVLTDGVVSYSEQLMEQSEDDVIYEKHIWDIARIYRQDRISNGNDKIEIDFEHDQQLFVENKNAQIKSLMAPRIQCMKLEDSDPCIDSYLAIMPGNVLAVIYNQYRTLLLEKNVRAFLRNKSKVNKSIMKTLKEEPEMFFAYNNGISTTASEVEMKLVGRTMRLTKLVDWQIVNGGQTTASIACTQGVDLSKVFVQMKINVVKNRDKYQETVRRISTCANSQTGIKPSDFESGEKYLVDMEKLSKEEIAPVTNTKWFFERMRGQYTDIRENLGKIEAKNFKAEYPKNQVLTKIDVARLVTIWNMKPHIACNSREKCFISYMNSLKKTDVVIDALYWHRIIALSILYKKIDACVNRLFNKNGFKTRITAYTMSVISHLSEQKLNLSYIWSNQKTQSQLDEVIDREVRIVQDYLEQDNSRTFIKKASCWEDLKALVESHPFPMSLLENVESNVVEYNEAEKNIIAQANAISIECWKAMLVWAESDNRLSQLERTQISNSIKRKERDRLIISLNHAQRTIELKRKAEALGFSGITEETEIKEN